jgi:hypothetical protein
MSSCGQGTHCQGASSCTNFGSEQRGGPLLEVLQTDTTERHRSAARRTQQVGESPRPLTPSVEREGGQGTWWYSLQQMPSMMRKSRIGPANCAMAEVNTSRPDHTKTTPLPLVMAAISERPGSTIVLVSIGPRATHLQTNRTIVLGRLCQVASSH